jgi:prepilin-type N-terminal cleavage/methylation domain-containing protein
MLKRARRRLYGFTLLEVVVALLVIAMLAAAIYPTALGQIRSSQASALASQLDNLREAIVDFRENVTHYPQTLTQLTTSPLSGNDICNNPIANPALWRGPYMAANIIGSFPVGDATVQNTLVRNPPGQFPTGSGFIQINVTAVDTLVAASLERQFDGNALNYATGTILWQPVTGGTLVFQIPIKGC